MHKPGRGPKFQWPWIAINQIARDKARQAEAEERQAVAQERIACAIERIVAALQLGGK